MIPSHNNQQQARIVFLFFQMNGYHEKRHVSQVRVANLDALERVLISLHRLLN